MTHGAALNGAGRHRSRGSHGDSLDMLFARGRIELAYLLRHGRRPDLADPKTFTERVQRRKLYDRDPRMPMLTDKVQGKQWVRERLGDEWIIPTLWQGCHLPADPVWPLPFVVKSRHGCNQTAFVRTGQEDWAAIRARARRWMSRSYGRWLDEWAYRDVERGLLVEPFIGEGGELPIDYKFYVFSGRVAFVQVHLERERNHRWLLYDRSWRRLSAAVCEQDLPQPNELGRMTKGAELLDDGFDFVRVDLYSTNVGMRFGEMTFYPGSGLDRFDPVTLDREIGAHWQP